MVLAYKATELVVVLYEDPCPFEAYGQVAASMLLSTSTVGGRYGMTEIIGASIIGPTVTSG